MQPDDTYLLPESNTLSRQITTYKEQPLPTLQTAIHTHPANV